MTAKEKKRIKGLQKPALQIRRLSSLMGIALIAGLVLGVNSCKKQESGLKRPTFSLTKLDGTAIEAGLQFQGDSTSEAFKIVSNGHWDVVTDVDWISVNPEGGDKNGDITITVAQNAYKKREATIRFVTDTLRIDTFFVSQEGLGLILSVTPEEVKGFSSDGRDTTFRIQANGNKWEYSIDDADWFTEKQKTDTTLTLAVASNPNEEERETDITFKLSDYPSFNQTIKFSQLGSAVAKADLLDIVFNDNRTAKDTSPLHLPVEYMSKSKPVTIVYNEILKGNVAYFDPPKPGSWLNYQGSWYHVEYKDNSDFSEKISDGFSMACLVKFDINFQNEPQDDGQTFFSMFEGGGAGFMVSEEENDIIFQVSISKDVKVNNSNIVPDNSTWYYLVGVWDKEAGKTYLYVNGEKKAEVDGAVGDYTPPSVAAGADWLCIGGGLAWQTIGEAFKGGVAIARIYDKPLAPTEVKKQWEKMKQLND